MQVVDGTDAGHCQQGIPHRLIPHVPGGTCKGAPVTATYEALPAQETTPLHLSCPRTFHEHIEYITESGGRGAQREDGEEESADGISRLVLRLQGETPLSLGPCP